MSSARACCRVDLAGGTLDIWPLGLLHRPSATVNVAIDVMVQATVEAGTGGCYEIRQAGGCRRAGSVAELREHPDTALAGVVAEALDLPPMTVILESASPRGGGLGASSAMAVALIAAAEDAFALQRSGVERRARMARDLEARLMGLPTGTQDHYAALLGGAVEIRHLPGGAVVSQLPVDLDGLGACLLVVHSGQSHFSAGQNWQVVRRRLEGEAEVTELLSGIGRVAADLTVRLAAGDLRAVGSLMAEEWALRRRLAPGISTPAVERLLEEAARAGAWGGKVCGAGGGGCVAILCPPARRADLAAQLRQIGGEVLAARPVSRPLAILT
jgi:D-glycero-alpha-D-manno-heptose-7-phosphate kinase